MHFPAPDRVTFIKAPQRNSVGDNAPVEALVAEIIENVRERGDAAVREYSQGLRQGRPRALRGHGGRARRGAGRTRPADPRRYRVRHRERPPLRRGAARHHPAARDRDPAGAAPRPPRHPDRARRLLRSGRPLSPAVGADHDHRARQGRGRRRGRSPACRPTPTRP